MLLRIIIAFLLLLSFGLQTFSYGVLLVRHQNHFDCKEKKEQACDHSKDASSCCNGNCELAKEIKRENAKESNSSLEKISKLPEPAEEHFPTKIECNSCIEIAALPFGILPNENLPLGAYTPVFHPPLC